MRLPLVLRAGHARPGFRHSSRGGCQGEERPEEQQAARRQHAASPEDVARPAADDGQRAEREQAGDEG
ncbi:hypothetical protein [Streptomyces sp. 8N616]|uniref:hypothetical protein n=1 Tax=Streptomyces sp. 8N616 TaxID=3457414 RepID=UPI003FD47106